MENIQTTLWVICTEGHKLGVVKGSDQGNFQRSVNKSLPILEVYPSHVVHAMPDAVKGHAMPTRLLLTALK